MSLPITCAVNGLSVDVLAVQYNGANSCENLGWEYTYDGVPTYFEKQHVVEEYDEPIVLRGQTRLPIVFNEGAVINMHIEFTSVTFQYGAIQLVDVLHYNYNLYDGEPETIMISMEIRNGNDVSVLTWNGYWAGRGSISPFPFQTGIVYKVTFKALGSELQVLLNDQPELQYAVGIHSSNAVLLHFDDVGMLLHKIEFVA
ncbi:hypothetical protein ACF0H5_014925 [Mactra antiquata]